MTTVKRPVGRPKTDYTCGVYARVTPDTHRELLRQAKKEERSLATIVRRALTEELKTRRGK